MAGHVAYQAWRLESVFLLLVCKVVTCVASVGIECDCVKRRVVTCVCVCIVKCDLCLWRTCA